MSEQHLQYWARTLLGTIEEMAVQQTNPVLLILDGAQQIQTGQRYPDAGLVFGNSQWRVFYHCHGEPGCHAKEHGHFHLFTHQDDDWAHLAGLSIEPYGQPLQWFCVNRWVTGGPWLSHCQLLQKLRSDDYSDADPLIGRWLFAMLQLYRDTLQSLYRQRDQHCQSLIDTKPWNVFFEDRDIYTLTSLPIDIQSTLETTLATATPSTSSRHQAAGCAE